MGVVMLMALTAAATWMLASRFQSPQQIAAAASPPPPGAITAPVTRGDLRDSFTVRVRIAPADSSALSLSFAPGQVVTDAPAAPGSRLNFGSIVLQVNGRPVFLTEGRFPYYRDLATGLSGPDVAQWQSFLRGQGYSIGRSEQDRFGPETTTATRRFYIARGQRNALTEPAESASGPEAERGAPKASEAGSQPAVPSGRQQAGERGDVVADPQTHLVIPASDLLVASAAGQTVVSTPAVGEKLTEDSAVTVSGGEMVANVSIPALDAASLQQGMRVLITPPSGQPVEGSLGTIPPPGKRGEDGQVPPVTVRVDVDGGIPASWAGQDLLAEVVKQDLSANALIVPSRAIARDGGPAVFVKQTDGTFQRTPVRELGSVRGRTAVEAGPGSRLDESSIVRVG